MIMNEKCKYSGIAEMIKYDIFNHKFKENIPLPSIRELAQIFHTNPATISRALHLLREQKIIYNNRTNRFYIYSNITETRQKFADHLIKEFLKKMVIMGYSTLEIQEMIKEVI